MDKLIVRDLSVSNIIGVDAWERTKRQPLIITLVAFSSVGRSGLHDLLSESVSYSSLAKEAQAYSESTAFRSFETLAGGIALVCLSKFPLEKITVSVRKPRALLHAASAGVEITRTRIDIPQLASLASVGGQKLPDGIPDMTVHKKDDGSPSNHHCDVIFINDLVLSCIIGVNAWEREERQRVIVNLRLHLRHDNKSLLSDQVPKMHNYRAITRIVSQHIEASTYKTVEALVMNIARLLITVCFVPKVTVRAEKPSALVFAEAAGVEITRTRDQLLDEIGTLDVTSPLASPPYILQLQQASVFVAVGTNMGDRVSNIEAAFSRIIESGSTRIVDTSFLYETSPMYVTDQPLFLNACIRVETSLDPHALLDLFKRIESDLGRDLVNGQRFGPRPIDLDILYYNELELKTDRLVIPHPRISEREFVLRPLCDIARHMEHPGLYRTSGKLLALLKHSETAAESTPETDSRIWRVVPVRGRLWRVDERTHIMGILNVTPDSFSDGGQHTTIQSAVDRALEMITQGADMIDIGGQSTRPNADEITEQEELDRIVPVIRAIRAKNTNIPISVDTYHASVARAAVDAGADFINDVTGGSRDPEMLNVMARSQIPVCLMHMRGNSKTMMQLTDYTCDLIADIRTELSVLVQNALVAGVRRWNVLVDPGIGFAKTPDQSYEILRHLRGLTISGSGLDGFPVLVGPSRKGFIGKTIGETDPAKRGWGTAAACSAAVASGVCVVRVHDVKEMYDVVRVADQCFRV